MSLSLFQTKQRLKLPPHLKFHVLGSLRQEGNHQSVPYHTPTHLGRGLPATKQEENAQ
jgi:hypothetical protein